MSEPSGSSGDSGDPFADLSDAGWDHLSDEQLVSGLLNCFKNGHDAHVEQAWDRLYQRHSSRIWRYLAYLLKHSQLQEVAELARELMHTIFANAFIDLVTRKAPEDFPKPNSSFKGWIRTFAKNEFYEYMKKLGRHPSLDAMLEEGEKGPQLALVAPEADPASENSERRIAIEEAISKLPPREAQVFRLVFYGQMNVKQIAQQLNLPDNTVQMAYYRARKRFKEIYAGPRPATSKQQKLKRRRSSPPRNRQPHSDEPV